MSDVHIPVTRAFPVCPPGSERVDSGQNELARAEGGQLAMASHRGRHRVHVSRPRALANTAYCVAILLANYAIMATLVGWPIPGGGQ